MLLLEKIVYEILLLEKKDHLIKKIEGLTDQQVDQIIKHFQKFPHLEKEIDWNRADLSWSDFQPLLKQVSKTQKRKKVSKFGIGGLKEGDDYIKHPSNDFEGYLPITHEASRLLASKRISGCEGAWCISQNDPEQWEEYKKKGIAFMFVFKDGKKYAITIYRNDKSLKIFDQENEEISEEEFIEKKELIS